MFCVFWINGFRVVGWNCAYCLVGLVVVYFFLLFWVAVFGVGIRRILPVLDLFVVWVVLVIWCFIVFACAFWVVTFGFLLVVVGWLGLFAVSFLFWFMLTVLELFLRVVFVLLGALFSLTSCFRLCLFWFCLADVWVVMFVQLKLFAGGCFVYWLR